MASSIIWLALGALLIAMEVFGIPGIGFLFAGLSAVTVAILTQAGATEPDSYGAQTAWWFGLTLMWAALLWKPLKNWRTSKNSQEYSNIIGDTAYIINQDLHKGITGQASWSGTTMNAEIAPYVTADKIPAGSKVKIIDVRGVTLIVEPA